MRQIQGEQLSGDPLVAAPADSADVGFNLELTQGQAKVSRWALQLVANAAVDWDLWVREVSSGHWMNATAHVVGYAKTINGRRVFLVEHIGIYDRAAVVSTNAVSVVKLTEYIENNFLRGD